MLPGISGIEVCKKIREYKIITPIIMLTAKTDISDKVLGLNSGADDYVPKPFSFEELLARVNALSRRAAYRKTDIIQIDDLEVDIQKREVFRKNKKINLTAKEYEIFELLIKNRGHLVKIKNIINVLWENDNDISSNVVNVYMHHLRHKIDESHKKSLLKL
jgi:DNA-binding response OmpR family regulator